MPHDLASGQRAYGFWGKHPLLYQAGDWLVFLGRKERLHREAVQAVGLGPGATVLDLACGHGVNFRLLEQQVGRDGAIIALDYSDAMLAQARSHAARHEWDNIEFRQQDAACAALPPASLDGALCTLGLSAIPDSAAAIAAVAEALRPGGRFVVLDATLFHGPAKALNPLLKPVFTYACNWDAGKDVVTELRAGFADVTVTRYNAGSMFLAVASTPTGT